MERYYFDKFLYYDNVINQHAENYLEPSVCEILHDKLVTPIEGSKLGRIIYNYPLKDEIYTVRLGDCVVD